MNRSIKYANLLLFLFTLLLFFSFANHFHISTSLLSVLPQSKNKEIIQKFEAVKDGHLLMVAVKGLDDASLETMKSIEEALEKVDQVQAKKFTPNKALEAHQEQYQFFIQKLDKEKLDNLDVKEELGKLYQSLTQSFFPTLIDQHDPFDLYTKTPYSSDIYLVNNHLAIEGYGYLAYFDIGSQNLEQHRKVYKEINSVLSLFEDKDVTLFSPIFYYVENSQVIRSDVNHIVFFAFSVLLILYLFILRNLWLLLNALSTLATSAIIAIMAVTLLYPEVSIFVIVFGISISTVSIDYLFHHYLHDYYGKKKQFNKEVFFGFLTTAGAFIIISFTDFTLIRQISIFSALSLGIAYLHFAFLYPKIGFEQKKTFGIKFMEIPCKIPYQIIFLLSSLVITASFSWLRLDMNVKNLDYDNHILKQKEHFFKTHLSKDEPITVLIEADSLDQLIIRSKKVQLQTGNAYITLSGLVDSDSFHRAIPVLEKLSQRKKYIEQVASATGFREGFFDKAYPEDLALPHYKMEDLKKYGLKAFKIDADYYTYGTVDKKMISLLSALPYVKSLSVKNLFEKSMEENLDKLILLGLLVILFILSMLLIISRKKVIQAFTFLLFPLAVILLYGYFVPLNILHIFMIFVILSISIDYAIYTIKSTDDDTKRAITFSLMSTFAGFGVLIISQINALFSIGIIATLGIIAIFMLLIFLKGSRDVS